MFAAELKKRVLTGLVLIAGVLALGLAGVLVPGGSWLYLAGAFLLIGLSSIEFSGICNQESAAAVRRCVYLAVPLLAPVAVLFLFSEFGSSADAAGLNLGLLSAFSAGLLCVGAALVYVIVQGRSSLAQARIVAEDLCVGAYLIGFGGTALMSLTMLDDSYRSLLWLLLVVCVNDITAYFAGKRIGGAKLAPQISPNKTISGSAAGLAAGGLTGCLCLKLTFAEYSWETVLLLSFLVAGAAQLGDLAKSYVKRLHNVKDSGALLPGHGGVLDRIDGILGASPVLYFCLMLRLI